MTSPSSAPAGHATSVTPEAFLGHETGVPGPTEEAARWLAGRGVRATGAETIAYEQIKPEVGHALLPVHRLLLVEHGIHIIEVMNLSGLAAGRRARVRCSSSRRSR